MYQKRKMKWSSEFECVYGLASFDFCVACVLSSAAFNGEV
jgi:hypothetical protein